MTRAGAMTMMSVCGCSDEVIVKCTSESSLYTSQAVKTYLRFSTPASADWLVCQAEAVRAKTVHLGSCACCA